MTKKARKFASVKLGAVVGHTVKVMPMKVFALHGDQHISVFI